MPEQTSLGDLWCCSGRDRPSILIATDVIEHVQRYRQHACWKREAGGQLFGQIGDRGWRVVVATGPRRSDMRSRFGFVADRRAEQREIDRLFASGLHYVGDWHTHPEKMPKPSGTDLASMAQMVDASRHELCGFVMMIVGTLSTIEGLWLSFHPTSGSYERLRLDRLHLQSVDDVVSLDG